MITQETAVQHIVAAERLLRRVVGRTLSQHGPDWQNTQLGEVRPMLVDFRQREQHKRPDAPDEPNLVGYAGLPQLRAVIAAHWTCCFSSLSMWTSSDVMTGELDRLQTARNPSAHGRELFPHEYVEAEGVARRLRFEIENIERREAFAGDKYWPRLEQLADSLGNKKGSGGIGAAAKSPIFEGDLVQLKATAFDPHGRTILFEWGGFISDGKEWSDSDELEWTAGPVGPRICVCVRIKTQGAPETGASYDDELCFYYDVRPRSAKIDKPSP